MSEKPTVKSEEMYHDDLAVVENITFDPPITVATIRRMKAQLMGAESKPNRIEIRPGQIWQDNDKRATDRLMRVIEVGEIHAIVQRCDSAGKGLTHRTNRIPLRRFRPNSTGYRLVSE